MKKYFLIFIAMCNFSVSLIAYSASAEKVFLIASPSIVVIHIFDNQNQYAGQGSGVVVGSNKVVTNCHVAEALPDLIVKIDYKGKTYQSKEVAHLKDYDLCLLETSGINAPVAQIKSASKLNVGQKVYAIGAPKGFDLSITDGLISSIRKDKDSAIIQTSAAISPGSSGGGLFDENGQLIGITTFKVLDAESINFAHIADHVIDLLEMSADINSTKSITIPLSVEEGNNWLAEMSKRLENTISDKEYREDFLRTLHYEATRAGLDPQMVLAFIEVVSGFKKYASNSSGDGLMRVNKIWIQKIGSPDHNLFKLRLNLRYGCTILRHYIDVEKGDLHKALNLYNGSPENNPDFPNQVLKTWRTKWDYQPKMVN